LSSISVGIGHFNADHRLDMVVINEDTGNFDIFVGSYEGLSNQTKYSVGSGPICVALADFNNDTQLDISVINYDSSDMSILLGYGDGTFASQTHIQLALNQYRLLSVILITIYN